MKLTRPEAGGEIDDFRAIRSPLPTDLAADGRDPAAAQLGSVHEQLPATSGQQIAAPGIPSWFEEAKRARRHAREDAWRRPAAVERHEL